MRLFLVTLFTLMAAGAGSSALARSGIEVQLSLPQGVTVADVSAVLGFKVDHRSASTYLFLPETPGQVVRAHWFIEAMPYATTRRQREAGPEPIISALLRPDSATATTVMVWLREGVGAEDVDRLSAVYLSEQIGRYGPSQLRLRVPDDVEPSAFLRALRASVLVTRVEPEVPVTPGPGLPRIRE